MSKYLIDCPPNGVCTMTPYIDPPATLDHYALGPEWALLVAGALILVLIIAVSVVRYKAHEERGTTERERIHNPPSQCPTCGDVLETK